MRRLHPATIVVSVLPKLKEAIQAAIPLLIASVASGQSLGHSQEWIGLFIGGFTGLFALGTYFTTRFDVEADHITHQTGWIFRKDRRIPLVQIQNVNLRQNLLERLLGVATVDVETAMGRGRDLKLSVLKLGDAERLREELLEAVHLETPGAPKLEEKPVISLNSHDLLFGAFTENHIGQVLTAMFLLFGPMIGAVTRLSKGLPSSVEGAIITATLVLLVVVSWLWGAASYYLKYGGFEVHRNEKIFKISYGLLNKAQLVVRPSRIELLQIKATLPQRWLRRAAFMVGTASSFGEVGVLAPVALFVERHRAYASAGEVIAGLDIDSLRWQRFSPVYYRAVAVRVLIALVSLLGLAWVVARAADDLGSVVAAWMIFGLIAGLILLSTLCIFLSIAENSYAITGDVLVVRKGYITQSISVMPIQRMENVSITQPFWWKRYGAVTLGVQAMRNRLHVPALPASVTDELLITWREMIDSRENCKLYEALAEEAEPAAEALAPQQA